MSPDDHRSVFTAARGSRTRLKCSLSPEHTQLITPVPGGSQGSSWWGCGHRGPQEELLWGDGAGLHPSRDTAPGVKPVQGAGAGGRDWSHWGKDGSWDVPRIGCPSASVPQAGVTPVPWLSCPSNHRLLSPHPWALMSLWGPVLSPWPSGSPVPWADMGHVNCPTSSAPGDNALGARRSLSLLVPCPQQ